MLLKDSPVRDGSQVILLGIRAKVSRKSCDCFPFQLQNAVLQWNLGSYSFFPFSLFSFVSFLHSLFLVLVLCLKYLSLSS